VLQLVMIMVLIITLESFSHILNGADNFWNMAFD